MSDSERLLPICVGDRWGYVDLRGEIVVPCQYPSAGKFSDGFATICVRFDHDIYENHEILVINDKLREVGRLTCEYWADFSEGLMVFKRNDGYGYVDTTLQVVIPPTFRNAHKFVDGLAWASVNTTLHSGVGGVIQREGLINRRGEWIIPPNYDTVRPFQRNERITGFRAGIPRKWPERLKLLYPRNAVEAMLIDYNNARADGLSMAEAEITSDLAMVNSAMDDPMDEISLDDLSRYVRGESRSEIRAWGLLDRQGHVVVVPRFQSVGWPNNGMLAAGMQVGDEYKEGVINERGEWLIEPRWDDTDGGFTDDLMSAAIDGKWGLVNRQGEWVIRPQYTNVRKFSDGLCGVYVGGRRDLDYCLLGGKYGFINKAGEMVIEPRFDDVFDFEDGICKVELVDGDPKDNLSRYGYIDTQGRYIWEPTR